MKKPIRVLQGIVANDKGGLTSYICQNYRYIDKSKIQFDFITYDDTLDFQKEFENMGACFYKLPRASNILKYYFIMKKIQSVNHYEIVHYNMSYANIVPLLIAKLVGIKRVIIHSHSTQIDSKSNVIRKLKECFHSVFKNALPIIADDYFACSTEAAEWMFPKSIIDNHKYNICHNAINTKRFAFDEAIRKKVRDELSINEETLVIGHVGRFTYQKNHEFILDVYSEVLKKRNNVILMLVGSGELEEEVKEKARVLGLNNILYMGQRNDVNELMQAMDIFLLPSRFEGLCLVGIEAQCCGLPCLFSDAITKEVGITHLAHFLSMGTTAEWVNEIIYKYNPIQRVDMSKATKEAGYDISNEIKKVEVTYLDERNMILCTPPRN